MKARFYKRTLNFKIPAGTSRGILHTKDSYFLILEKDGKKGIGECSILPNLSIEGKQNLKPVFNEICHEIAEGKDFLMEKWNHFPAVKFAIEMAFQDLEFGVEKEFFANDFFVNQQGILTNGLIWMGDKSSMKKQIEQKLQSGFSCVKLKIGAIDWKEELALLESIRNEFSADKIELRVDANGAFLPNDALGKLKELAVFDIHSIEQPIRQGQIKQMANLVQNTPIPIALDEELIAVREPNKREKLLRDIQPHYIILKPSLLGGFSDADEWISIAEKMKINWWATSALESNIGLNAIAQWVSQKKPKLPQGLGTGSLFSNNIQAPLKIRGERLYYGNESWEEL
ncbi:MAG: o-succinylbenzoate synthase [Flavobacteriales bacterium]|jgi:o-succinylbenzoate synthase|nr:o-succinylbenzoate synthase [Flavobacteriales bacterium]